jgi:putative molybdopterin biosynthesis protein
MKPAFRNLTAFTDIKLLSDERRLAIVRLLMRQPATLSQLGEQMGVTPARVRHHVKRLEEHGFIEMLGNPPAGGFTEKYYRASAQAYFIQRAILPESAADGTVFIIGSHDPALDQFAEHLNASGNSPELFTVPIGSLNGLAALRQGLCQITGCHLYEPLDGTYNTAYVRHFFPGERMEIVTLAHRQQGLLVAPGNPYGIHSLADLAREGIRFVNRCRGSGTRLWFDQQLRELDIPPAKINGYTHELDTHTQIAYAILSGTADAGLAVRAAAQANNLGFIPIFEERFDLVLSETTMANPLVARLLDSLCSGSGRQRIAAHAGYRTNETGNHAQVR